MKPMTMRERMLALVEGREHDRVPFVQYGDLAAPREEIWSVIGRGNMGLLRWTHAHRFDHPNCRFDKVEFERSGARGFSMTLHTPAGSLTQEKHREPAYGTHATRRHFVREPDDYRVLLAYLRDIIVSKDLADVRDAIRSLGDDGLAHFSVNRTPYQQLWVEWVSVQDLALHLVDCPELVAEVVEALRAIERQVFAIACEAVRELPIPYVTFPDNITAPVVGEKNFRKYCVPSYRKLAEMLAETGRDVLVFVHMDGDLKPLWAAIGESGVRGLDSMSPPPDNDTSVADAVRQWPDMRVLVNFPSSVHLAEPRAIRAAAERLLAEGGRSGRLQIQISENVPPGRWRVSFPEILAAIESFA